MGSGYKLAAVAGAILGVAALLVATLALGGASMGGGEASPAAGRRA